MRDADECQVRDIRNFLYRCRLDDRNVGLRRGLARGSSDETGRSPTLHLQGNSCSGRGGCRGSTLEADGRLYRFGGAIHFQCDITFDHVLPTGQKLQFSAVENIALQRPNGLYIEWSGDLGDRRFWYNGKTVSIYDPSTVFYGADAAPPALDDMLDKVIKQLNFTPPLTDFLYSDPYKSVRGTIQYGFVTGDTQINGRSCRGLAFVEKHIDWQIWIDTGPQPVPCKLLITYKNNSALPQFSAIFSDWDFAPRIAASVFTPEFPPELQKIPSRRSQQAPAPNSKAAGG